MRVRLAIIGASPCVSCTAACCKQNGHEYAAILRGEEVRKFAAYSMEAAFRSERGVVVERVLPYVEGRCQFLDEEDRCRIYEDRPGACRAFECVPDFNREGVGRHGEFLQRNGGVREMLDAL
jgi:Fe-S-cluster containining protein